MSIKVSVIIPTYNRASVLDRAIQSVVEQSFEDWELIIVNDGSSDGTSELLKKYGDDLRIHVVDQENKGVSAARNEALRWARGEWVAFLDSDDEWLKDKLQKQMSFSEKNPHISIIHGDEIWIRNDRRVNPMKKHQKKGGDVFLPSLKLCCISPSTVVIKADLFKTIGYFREDFPVCEDYDLWLKITSRFEVGFVDDMLIKKYGGHQDQLSRKFSAMDYWRVLSIQSCLSEGYLSEQQTLAATEELQYKSRILLKGFLKHQNLKNYDDVFRIHFGLSL